MKTLGYIGSITVLAGVGAVLFGGQLVRQVNAEPEVSSSEESASILATLPEEVNPSTSFAELVCLVQSGVDESVLLSYINTTPRLFQLGSDEIIYLNDLGASASVIERALLHDHQLIEAGTQSAENEVLDEVASTSAGDDEVSVVTSASIEVAVNSEYSVDDFRATLSPYGSWVVVDGYGYCWRPTVGICDSNWRPYSNNGSWVYTDHGWYWKSNYSWGWAAFHYGRWFLDSRYGWCWWPDTEWAPSWVCWRYDNEYCGWAPLPPRTVYRPRVGIIYKGSVAGVDFDFGLTENWFTFVATTHLFESNLSNHRVRPSAVHSIYARTHNVHHYISSAHDHIVVNRGMPVEKLPVSIRPGARSVKLGYDIAAKRKKVDRMDHERKTLVVTRPRSAVVRSPRSKAPKAPVVKKVRAPQVAPSAVKSRSVTPRKEKTPSVSPQKVSPARSKAPKAPVVKKVRAPQVAPSAVKSRSVTPRKEKTPSVSPQKVSPARSKAPKAPVVKKVQAPQVAPSAVKSRSVTPRKEKTPSVSPQKVSPPRSKAPKAPVVKKVRAPQVAPSAVKSRSVTPRKEKTPSVSPQKVSPPRSKAPKAPVVKKVQAPQVAAPKPLARTLKKKQSTVQSGTTTPTAALQAASRRRSASRRTAAESSRDESGQ